MNLVRPFVERSAATLLVAFGVMIFGAAAWVLLPVAALPAIETPFIDVVANLPGGAPDTMASSVAAPLERQLAQINGLESIQSFSNTGTTFVSLRFSLKMDIDKAATEVQKALNNAAPDLPSGMPTPPQYFKENAGDRSILLLSLTSDVLPTLKVGQAGELVARRVARMSGVSRTELQPREQYAVRIFMNPSALAARGLSSSDVRDAITRASVDMPKGTIRGGEGPQNIESNDRLLDATAFRDVIVAYRNGAPVRLSDVANVVDGTQNEFSAAWVNGQPGVALLVRRQQGANTVQTVENILKTVPDLRASVPPAIKLEVAGDRAETIRASLNDVEITLAITIGLVILVIYLFLQNVWATIIPSVTIPLSLFATFIAMYWLGFTLDNLSLMALTISVGFVVDDAIVVLENIYRLMEQGKKPLEAAIEGGSQVGFTILSITLSLVAVFIPIFFLGGIVGRLFAEFAATVSIAILVSALIALSISPVLCHRLLRVKQAHATERKQSGIVRLLTGFYERFFDFYRRSISWVLRHQKLTLASFFATLAATFLLVVFVPKGFFPPSDNGRIYAGMNAPPDADFKQTAAYAQQVDAIVRADPDVRNTITFMGQDGGGENNAQIVIILKRRSERQSDVRGVMARLRESVKQVKAVQFFMNPESEIAIDDGPGGGEEFTYTLSDPDRDELNKWLDIIRVKLAEVPGLVDVNNDQQLPGKATHVVVNRDLASRLGLDSQAIDDALYDAFGDRLVTKIFTDSSQYFAILDVDPKFRTGEKSLDLIHIPAKGGRQIPLSAVAHFEQGPAPQGIIHREQLPSDQISFNLAPHVSIGEAVERIHKMEHALNKPPSLQTSFQGAAAEFEKSVASQPWLIAAATLIVYIVLGALYESAIHPLTILSSLPSAGVGALLALWATGHNLDVMGLIGIILLIGIVKKNAIMMVDFAIQAEKEGMSPEDAIREACLVRFRPIMMTTVAAIFGALPLAVGTGAGSELRQPLGISIVGGLMMSQMLTLYTTPVIHLMLRRATRWVASLFHRTPAPITQGGAD